ncbi:MAG: LacI family DNA-binding transcriptional regulator [Chthoniobacteraceae bacterium]|nr:LacI family DNA-binding transcriptional regulator [Chthoniobacteraceae bacterium]
MPEPAPRRPTLRDVAALARVSHMTVCRVVNGSHAVAEATAARVREAVKRLGYRPDPALSALAACRNGVGAGREQPSVLAFLDCDADAYSAVVLDGARREAEWHGYTVERVALPHDPAAQRKIGRQLFHRGVRGLLFGPSNSPWKFDGWDWPQFAAVSLGALNHTPALHSVSMDYFEGAVSGFHFLQARGCRRIALALSPKLDARTGHRWLGGYCAAAREARKPVLWAGEKWTAPALRGWLESARADGVLTIDPGVCAAARERGLAVAALNSACAPDVPHLRLDPRDIGVEGVRLLHPLVLRREYGLPAEPKRIALGGTWEG